jgi:CRP/FNR family transcriptional regulator, anaerobic regulatory protein
MGITQFIAAGGRAELSPPDVPCRFCQARRGAFCHATSAGELNLLERVRRYRRYRAGETVIRAGAPIGFLGTVIAGTALLTLPARRRLRQVVGLAFPSDAFGHPRAARAAPHTIEAATDLVVCSISHDDLQSLAISLPREAARLLGSARSELDAARRWTERTRTMSVRARLARLILTVARSQCWLAGDGIGAEASAIAEIPERIYLPLSRGAVADYLDIGREAVSHHLGQFVEEGLIAFESRRQLWLRDPERLRQVSMSKDLDAGAGPAPVAGLVARL